MNVILNPDKLGSVETRSRVENVSRRTILKGLGIAGGLVAVFVAGVVAGMLIGREGWRWRRAAG